MGDALLAFSQIHRVMGIRVQGINGDYVTTDGRDAPSRLRFHRRGAMRICFGQLYYAREAISQWLYESQRETTGIRIPTGA